jgi:predicted nucleic acid-binding protein
MTKALLDTNIVVDYFAKRTPFYEAAEEIVELAIADKFTGYITANSVTDIYYILRRQYTDEACREALRWLFALFVVIPVDLKDCKSALAHPLKDYEDALALICARKAEVDYVITRDENFLKTENAISPLGFLALSSLR